MTSICLACICPSFLLPGINQEKVFQSKLNRNNFKEFKSSYLDIGCHLYFAVFLRAMNERMTINILRSLRVKFSNFVNFYVKVTRMEWQGEQRYKGRERDSGKSSWQLLTLFWLENEEIQYFILLTTTHMHLHTHICMYVCENFGIRCRAVTWICCWSYVLDFLRINFTTISQFPARTSARFLNYFIFVVSSSYDYVVVLCSVTSTILWFCSLVLLS